MDIDIDTADESWKQLEVVFKGEDHCTLQTLVDNVTITPKPKEHIKPYEMPSRPQ